MRGDERESRFPSDAIVVPDTRPAEAAERALGDFTAGRASLGLAAIAVPLGACVTFLALALLDLIGLVTHLAYTALVRAPLVARPDETLRAVADRMVASGHGAFPVVDSGVPARLVGLVTQFASSTRAASSSARPATSTRSPVHPARPP